jgi:hypothetical protein
MVIASILQEKLPNFNMLLCGMWQIVMGGDGVRGFASFIQFSLGKFGRIKGNGFLGDMA